MDSAGTRSFLPSSLSRKCRQRPQLGLVHRGVPAEAAGTPTLTVTMFESSLMMENGTPSRPRDARMLVTYSCCDVEDIALKVSLTMSAEYSFSNGAGDSLVSSSSSLESESDSNSEESELESESESLVSAVSTGVDVSAVPAETDTWWHLRHVRLIQGGSVLGVGMLQSVARRGSVFSRCLAAKKQASLNASFLSCTDAMEIPIALRSSSRSSPVRSPMVAATRRTTCSSSSVNWRGSGTCFCCKSFNVRAISAGWMAAPPRAGAGGPVKNV